MSKKPATLKAREIVWAFIDEHHPDAWDDPQVLTSRELLEACVRVLRSHRITCYSPAHVRRWLSNPVANSPHVDEIALERAINFDWDVIRALTIRERQILGARLARMRDPFESESESARWGVRGRVAAPKSPRRLAWEQGTGAMQDALYRSVRTHRRQAEAVCA